MEQSIVTANRASRERLRQIATDLTDAELARSLGNGWTAGAVFGHLAFWDRRAFLVITRWEQGDHRPSPRDTEVINDAFLPQWLLLAPRAAADLAMAEAEAVDGKIASLSAQQLSALIAEQTALDLGLDRAAHRANHLNDLAARLGRHGTRPTATRQ